MMRKLLGVAIILVLSLGFVAADEFKGKVTKVNGTKITVENKKDSKSMDFDIAGAKVFSVAKKGDPEEPAEASAVKENSNVSVDYNGAKVNKVVVRSKKK